MLYFIQEVDPPHRIKIGYSKDPDRRIAVLAGILPQKIKVLKVIPGEPEDERWHHDFLRPFRVEGTREWYNPEPELLDFIESGDIRFAV